MNAKAEVDQANLETFMTRLKADWRQYVIYAGFVVIFIFFSITLSDKGFLDANNLLNIVRQNSPAQIQHFDDKEDG